MQPTRRRVAAAMDAGSFNEQSNRKRRCKAFIIGRTLQLKLLIVLPVLINVTQVSNYPRAYLWASVPLSLGGKRE